MNDLKNIDDVIFWRTKSNIILTQYAMKDRKVGRFVRARYYNNIKSFTSDPTDRDIIKENENIIHDKISDYDLTVSALFQQLEGIRQFNSGHGKDALAFFMKSLKLLNAASDKTPIDGLVSYIFGIKSEKLYVSPISKEDVDLYLQIISNCTSEKKPELLKYVMSLPVSEKNDN